MQPKTVALNNNGCTSGGLQPYWHGVDCNDKKYTGGNGKGLSPCQPNSRPSICPWDRSSPYTSLDGGGCSEDPHVEWEGEVCDLKTCKINWEGVDCKGKRYPDGGKPCRPNGKPTICSESSPYTSFAASTCSSDASEAWSGAVCDTRTCRVDWRGVDCKGKVYTGGNGKGLSPCRENGRPTICPWNGEAPHTALSHGGCSNDHTVNWNDVCDLNTCFDVAPATGLSAKTQLNTQYPEAHNNSNDSDHDDKAGIVLVTMFVTAGVVGGVAFVLFKFQQKRPAGDVVELEPVMPTSTSGSTYGASCGYSAQ